MKVWITSDKRWADVADSHWVAEILHDPRPESEPDDCIWDRVEERIRRCNSKDEAIATAREMLSNVMNVACVYRRKLQEVEGNIFDWQQDGDREECECMFVR